MKKKSFNILLWNICSSCMRKKMAHKYFVIKEIRYLMLFSFKSTHFLLKVLSKFSFFLAIISQRFTVFLLLQRDRAFLIISEESEHITVSAGLDDDAKTFSMRHKLSDVNQDEDWNKIHTYVYIKYWLYINVHVYKVYIPLFLTRP